MRAPQYGRTSSEEAVTHAKPAVPKVNYDSVPLAELADPNIFTNQVIEYRGSNVVMEFTSIATGVSTTRTIPANRLPSEYAKEAEAHKAEAATREAKAQQDARERQHMARMANQMFGPVPQVADKERTVDAAKARALREKRRAENRAKRSGPKKGAGGSKDLHGSSSKKKSGGKK